MPGWTTPQMDKESAHAGQSYERHRWFRGGGGAGAGIGGFRACGDGADGDQLAGHDRDADDAGWRRIDHGAGHARGHDGDDPGYDPGYDLWDHAVHMARAESELYRAALAAVDDTERTLIEAACGSW